MEWSGKMECEMHKPPQINKNMHNVNYKFIWLKVDWIDTFSTFLHITRLYFSCCKWIFRILLVQSPRCDKICHSICILTKKFLNSQLQPAGMKEKPLQASNAWQYAQTSVWNNANSFALIFPCKYPMTNHINIQVLCSIFLKIAMYSLRKTWNGCLSLKEIIFCKQRTTSSLGDVFCQWHLYLPSVTSLFNIFIWRSVNKKKRPRLGRDPSKFNLCVHKALHLSKWHFPISAFDSIDFFSSLPFPTVFNAGWNNKGSWVGFSVWTEHSGVLCFLTVETERWSI